jgi:hypothetical protein
MMNIQESLDNLDSMLITKQYEIILRIASQTQSTLANKKDQESINIAKQVRDKIHELRFRMAYNKASDSGVFDNKLKKAWESLNALIGSD